MSYVYIQSEPNLYTVGHYAPDRSWHTDSDHASKDEAAERVAYLNGKATELLFSTSAVRESIERITEQLRTADSEERLRAIVFEWCRLMNVDPWGSIAHSSQDAPGVQLWSTRWQYLMHEARAAVAWAQAILLCPPETRFPHGD